MSWILIAALCYMAWSAMAVLDKLVIMKHLKRPETLAAIIGLNGFLALLIVPFTGLRILEPMQMLLAIISGVTFTLFLVPYMMGLKREEATRAMIVVQLTPIFVLLLAFLTINERLTAIHLAGFAFLLASGLIVSVKPGSGLKLSKAFWLIILADIITAVSIVTAKAVYSSSALIDVFIWIRLSAAAAGAAMLLIPQYREDIASTLIKTGAWIKSLYAAKMLADFAALFALGYVLTKAPATLVNALGHSIFPIGVLLVSVLLLRIYPKAVFEEFSRKAIAVKAAAISLVVVGILLINA